MNRNLTVIFAAAAGFLGGLLSRYISLPAVHAQTATPPTWEIRARNFTLMDSQGAVAGTFTVRGTPGRIVLLDQNGREIWGTGTSLKPLSENSR